MPFFSSRVDRVRRYAVAALLAACCASIDVLDPMSDMAGLYSARADHTFTVEPADARFCAFPDFSRACALAC